MPKRKRASSRSSSRPSEPQKIYVITDEQLLTIRELLILVNAAGNLLDEAWRNLEASLSVLSGENEPEGWKKVHVERKQR